MNKWLLNKNKAEGFIKGIFHTHNWKQLRIGFHPLVARYCNCGVLETGNCEYYDNSVYQKRYKGDKAIEFITDIRDSIIERKQISKAFWDYWLNHEKTKEMQRTMLFDKSLDMTFYLNHEPIEIYNQIIKEIASKTHYKASA
jgi:hypothetical protein